MNSIKLISRCGFNNVKEKYIISRKILQYRKIQYFYSKEHNINDDVLLSKIIYNEVLGQKKAKVTQSNDEPKFLKYLKEKNPEVKENIIQNEESEDTTIVHFPYKFVHKFVRECNENPAEETSPNKQVEKSLPDLIHVFTPEEEKLEISEWSPVQNDLRFKNLEKIEKWAYEDQTNIELEQTFIYGSRNPHKPVSSIPCGGCGALLHCNDPTIPGFIPAEIFESKTKKTLSEETCQRCNFLREFDVALGANVSPSEYPILISQIKDKKALAIIMIDMLDFPCSIFPGILEMIGSTEPVIILGNKVDLLIKEGPDFLKHLKEALIWCFRKQKAKLDNVKHIGLISAKTGFGIEDFITVLQKNWGSNGDVYLIGCTNVGKSSLFNALINSDYCKVKAFDLMHRATISAWPGTTLNLLKFPIMKTQEWRLIARSKRLAIDAKEGRALEKLQFTQQNLKLEQIPLQAYVGRTFPLKSQHGKEHAEELNDSSKDLKNRKGINYFDPDFAQNNWFHDTPGVVHKDQIINLLTTSELLLTVPKKMLLPRNFHLKPGYSLFIGGLARLDYIDGADFVWFTVFASIELPITVTKLEDADYVYQKLLGSSLFRVPTNGKDRLAQWPSLLSKKFEFQGKFPGINHKQNSLQSSLLPKTADVDVVLSSAGWISVNVPTGYRCKIEAWTPEGRGICLRDFPIIKTGHTFRGPRISGTPAFKCVVKEIKGYSFTDPNPF